MSFILEHVVIWLMGLDIIMMSWSGGPEPGTRARRVVDVASQCALVAHVLGWLTLGALMMSTGKPDEVLGGIGCSIAALSCLGSWPMRRYDNTPWRVMSNRYHAALAS